jgi:hypothetical protein
LPSQHEKEGEEGQGKKGKNWEKCKQYLVKYHPSAISLLATGCFTCCLQGRWAAVLHYV